MNFTKKPSQRIGLGGCNGPYAVSATLWTAILGASQWLPCVQDTTQYLTVPEGSDHLMGRPMRERLGFERLRTDEHSSSSCR